MSEPALLQRLADAIQAQHESTLALQELASELIDHCSRMRSFTDRLHVMTRQDVMIAPPDEEPMILPRVLQNGPIVRER